MDGRQTEGAVFGRRHLSTGLTAGHAGFYFFYLAAAVVGTVLAGPAAAPLPSFTSPRTLGLSFDPRSVRAGDFDQDGLGDLAVADDKRLYFMAGRGDGYLQKPKLIFDAPEGGFFLASAGPMADLNGDGKLDLIYTASNSWVFLGDGQGGFTTRMVNGPAQVVGDFNLDGKLDLAGEVSTNVIVSLNQGDGLFGPPASYGVGLLNDYSDEYPQLMAADFDLDGATDFLRVSRRRGGQALFSVLLNNRDGSFRAGATQDAGLALTSRSDLGDFDKDGKVDFIAATDDPGPIGVALFLGNGDGTFQPPRFQPTPSRIYSAATADVNADGNLDAISVVPAYYPGASVWVLPGNGDGTFQTALQFGNGFSFGLVLPMAAADLNGDLKPDLAVINSSGIDVFLNNLGAAATEAAALALIRTGQTVEISWPADFTGVTLQSAADLSSNNWRDVAEEPVFRMGRYRSGSKPDQVQSFYRLRSTVLPSGSRGVLTNADFASLRRAVESGGYVSLTFDGAVALARTLIVKTDVILDASGHTVTLDGQSTFRHFVVNEGATLRLINFTLANGHHNGASGQTNQPGQPGLGGAIFSSGGTIELSSCRFINNGVLGGFGGPTHCSNCPFVSGERGGRGLGGAIYVEGGQLRATNCLFASNTATGGRGRLPSIYDSPGPGGPAFGGAVFCTNAAVTLAGVTFTENLALGGERAEGRGRSSGGDSNGGALAVAGGDLVISSCTFGANRARGPMGYGGSGRANGGALFLSAATARMTASYFTSNTATGGEGAAYSFDSPRASDGSGGAMLVDAGRVEIRDSAFVQNQASGGNGYGRGTFGIPDAGYGGEARGGAVSCRGGETTFINCTLSENSATAGQGSGHSQALGGAIEGDATLINVTMANNAAQAGTDLDGSASGPPVQIDSISGTFQLANTILFSPPSRINTSGTITDNGHNICSDQSASFSRASSRNGVDPLLGPPAFNGGPTPTMALLPGSPAIDAGDSSVCPGTDQRGVPRPAGLSCDIGAFELSP